MYRGKLISALTLALVLLTQPLLASVAASRDRVTYESSCGDKRLTVWQSGHVSYDGPNGHLELTITKDAIRGRDFEFRVDQTRNGNSLAGKMTVTFRGHSASSDVEGDFSTGRVSVSDSRELQPIIAEFSSSQDAELLREAGALAMEASGANFPAITSGDPSSATPQMLLQPSYSGWACGRAVMSAMAMVAVMAESCVVPSPYCYGAVLLYFAALNQVAEDCNFYN